MANSSGWIQSRSMPGIDSPSTYKVMFGKWKTIWDTLEIACNRRISISIPWMNAVSRLGKYFPNIKTFSQSAFITKIIPMSARNLLSLVWQMIMRYIFKVLTVA
jgi:hypothetical protein